MLKNKIIKKVYIFLISFIVILFLYILLKDSYKFKPFIEKRNGQKNLSFISTAYHDLVLDYYKVPVFSKYGGIDSLGKTIVYVTGDSDFYLLDSDSGKKKSYKLNPISVEKIKNNKKNFVINNKKELGEFGAANFGIKDILIEQFDGFENKIILVSSLNYLEEENCYNMSVYIAEIINEDSFIISDWKNIFSSKNCLKVGLTKNPKFAGTSSGGRLSKLDEHNILLSVGDFYSDGYNGPILSQDLQNDYGKILKLNIRDSSYNIFSFGHRNPQGLYIDKNKNIFSTEHGPEAGDEINLIEENKNYGWPLATFGTAYGHKKWPPGDTNNTHESFEKPIFSWGNQIAVSNLIVYEKKLFNKWKDNLIVTSLASKQLIRMVFDNEKKSIIYFENIPIKKRIRDIIQLDDGKIALLTDLPKSSEIILLDVSQ